MSKSKETGWIYGRDGTVPNNDDDYSHTGTATLVKPSVLPSYPHVLQAFPKQPKSPTPSQGSSDPNPTSTDLSPEDVKARLAETCLQRAKEYLAKNDPMQASEKLYKAAEESIKYLSEQNNITEFKKAQEKGMWSTGLLNSAPPKLSEKLDKKEIAEGWHTASYLHVQGFHENRLGTAEVKYALPYVNRLVQYVQEVNSARRKGNT